MSIAFSITPLLSNALTAFTLVLGSLFLAAPSTVLGILNDSEHDGSGNGKNDADDNVNIIAILTKLIGGVLIAYTINILLMLRGAPPGNVTDPIEHATANSDNEDSSSAVVASKQKIEKHRMALLSNGILGFVILLLGLLQDVHVGHKASMTFVAVGSIILIIGCIGMMISFFPFDSDNGSSAIAFQNRSGSDSNGRSNVGAASADYRPDNTIPLLEESELQHEDIETPMQQQQHQHQEEHVEANVNANVATEIETKSRIKGTKRLIKLAGPHTFYLYTGCVVLLIRLPFSLSIPHFVSETLGALARSDYAEAKTSIFLLFALGSVNAALDFWCVYLFGLTNLKITKGVRIDTFRAILRQDVAFFDFTKSGDLASRLNSDCGEMGGDLTWFFRFSIESVVRIVSIVTYMLWRSPKLGACTISVVPIVAAINKRYGDFLNKNAMEVQTALAKANSAAQEAFSCIRTVIAFASEQHEYDKYKDKIDEHYDLNVKQLYAQGFYYMLIASFLVNTVVQALLLYIGMIMVEDGTVSVEVLLAFMLYQSKLQNEVMHFFESYTSLIKSSGAGDKVFELLDRTIPEPGTGHSSVNSGNEPDVHQLDIKIRQLHFSYPSRPDQTILKGLDLDIPAGKTVALVGHSGCGKSTIMGLLQRFYDPCGGSIIISGQHLKDINLMSLRSRVGVVTQDPVLFTGSIRDNIVYSKESKTEEEIIDAAKLANAHQFIQSFPDGYDTQVGERGVQLSGGQKQRISIARAIISKPSLLLLDEATSALDNESEKLVQQALDQLLKSNSQMTTVVIAHRLQTVRNADNIAVLKHGCVSEQGSHGDLMEKKGIYCSMVRGADENGNLRE